MRSRIPWILVATVVVAIAILRAGAPSAATDDGATCGNAHAHCGCDPRGPVHVEAERIGDAFRIRVETTLEHRGAVRIATELPEGVSWIDGAAEWTGTGTRELRFTGVPGEGNGVVEARMIGVDGTTYRDRALLVFDSRPNAVREARAVEGGRLEIPAVMRPEGGRR